MKTYSEVQTELLSIVPNGYKLSGYLHDHTLSLKQFIYLFLDKLNKVHETVTNNAVINHTVCDTSRRRSLADIFLICRFYYPDCTLKQVREILVTAPCKVSYCPDIERFVYYAFNGNEQIIGPSISVWKYNDEYGWSLKESPND